MSCVFWITENPWVKQEKEHSCQLLLEDLGNEARGEECEGLGKNYSLEVRLREDICYLLLTSDGPLACLLSVPLADNKSHWLTVGRHGIRRAIFPVDRKKTQNALKIWIVEIGPVQRSSMTDVAAAWAAYLPANPWSVQPKARVGSYKSEEGLRRSARHNPWPTDPILSEDFIRHFRDNIYEALKTPEKCLRTYIVSQAVACGAGDALMLAQFEPVQINGYATKDLVPAKAYERLEKMCREVEKERKWKRAGRK